MSWRTTVVCILLASCADTAALTRIIEARRRTADVHSAVASAAKASDHAVMAETNEASRFADTAGREVEKAERELVALESLVHDLGYDDEGRLIATLRTDFDHYRALDRDVLAGAADGARTLALGQKLALLSSVDHTLVELDEHLEQRTTPAHR